MSFTPKRHDAVNAGEGSELCREYGIDKLVYLEAAERIEDAIAREKAIKQGGLGVKVAPVRNGNSDWRDLFFDLDR